MVHGETPGLFVAFRHGLGAQIGRNTVVNRAILDKHVVIEEGAMVGIDREHDLERGFTVTESGITVVPKGKIVSR